MEKDAEASLFWLGIDSEGGEAEWQALVRHRLEQSRAVLTILPPDPPRADVQVEPVMRVPIG